MATIGVNNLTVVDTLDVVLLTLPPELNHQRDGLNSSVMLLARQTDGEIVCLENCAVSFRCNVVATH